VDPAVSARGATPRGNRWFDDWLESAATDIIWALVAHQGQDFNNGIEEQPEK